VLAESEARLPLKCFDITVRQVLAAADLEGLSDAEADAAGDEGYLRGNSRYEDHRGWAWSDVRDALKVEAPLVAQIASATDSAAAESAFDAARDPEIEGAEVLWGLDIGVAAAVITLSALGATPFISCNASTFGGPHPAARPYVAFYISGADPVALIDLAKAADVGLEAEDGVACLYARCVLDLLRFAELAEQRSALAP
jgi:hypothetical protein